MRARKIEKINAQVNGYCHRTESPRLTAVQLLKKGKSARDVATQLDMSIIDVISLAERLA